MNKLKQSKIEFEKLKKCKICSEPDLRKKKQSALFCSSSKYTHKNILGFVAILTRVSNVEKRFQIFIIATIIIIVETEQNTSSQKS